MSLFFQQIEIPHILKIASIQRPLEQNKSSHTQDQMTSTNDGSSWTLFS